MLSRISYLTLIIKESGDKMPSNFWNGTFYFDGIQSSVYKVCLVDINSRESLKQIGGAYSITIDKEIGYKGTPLYKESECALGDIILQICRTDGKPWTATTIIEINNWLFQEGFKKFQPGDLDNQGYNIIYYLKAISMDKKLNPNMYGYLEFTFKSYDGYGYAIPSNSLTVGSGETRNITSLSNVDEIYYPKMKIKNLGNKSNVITITNQTNGKSLSITNMQQNEVITIDCKIGSVLGDSGNNRFSVLQNFDFIGLSKGNNTISVSKNCSVEFICEFPVRI